MIHYCDVMFCVIQDRAYLVKTLLSDGPPVKPQKVRNRKSVETKLMYWFSLVIGIKC